MRCSREQVQLCAALGMVIAVLSVADAHATNLDLERCVWDHKAEAAGSNRPTEEAAVFLIYKTCRQYLRGFITTDEHYIPPDEIAAKALAIRLIREARKEGATRAPTGEN